MREPKRGEVWLVDLGMSAKVRPCLVLSVPIEEMDRALVTLVPHTTAVRASRFECALRVPFLREGAFDAQGIVTVPTVKLLRRLGQLQPAARQNRRRSCSVARPSRVSAVQLFAAADERPYAGPALKRLVLCKLRRVSYAGMCRPLAAERKIRWTGWRHRSRYGADYRNRRRLLQEQGR